MEEEQKDAYRAFQEDLLTELRAALHAGSRRLLGKYLQALLGYSDSPWVKETINDGDRVIAESTPLKEDKLYPKEVVLLRICQEAKRAGRRTVVYVIHTDTRDLTERLKRILQENGLRADILQASKIRPKKREEWIQSNRADVLITHPKTVSTGLDLVDFPEVVWYQQDYSIYILRQASRRSWRIGQTKPVNVHYLFYKNSIQDKAIKLNIQKLRAALLTEGDLVDEGLVTQAEDDGLVSLAKAIISHTDEKASLKSELARLCALGDQSDFILPEQGSPQELQVEKSEPNAEWPSQPENAQPIEPAPLPQLPPQIKKPAVKSRRGTVDPNQLALFYFREAAG